jgi:hypothetical protein
VSGGDGTTAVTESGEAANPQERPNSLRQRSHWDVDSRQRKLNSPVLHVFPMITLDRCMAPNNGRTQQAVCPTGADQSYIKKTWPEVSIWWTENRKNNCKIRGSHGITMWCIVALVRTDVSEEHIASITRMERISEPGTLAVKSNWSMLQRNILMMETISSSETLILTQAIRRHMSGNRIYREQLLTS